MPGCKRAVYAIVHSENETDVSKRNVRACTFDLILDLVPLTDGIVVDQWRPKTVSDGSEGEFLRIVGEAMLRVGNLADGWREDLNRRLRESAFLSQGRETGNALKA